MAVPQGYHVEITADSCFERVMSSLPSSQMPIAPKRSEDTITIEITKPVHHKPVFLDYLLNEIDEAINRYNPSDLDVF